MKLSENKKLRCAGSAMQKCEEKEISYIDAKGFIYCRKHGEMRQGYMPVLKLSKNEIANLENGIPLKGKFL